MDVWAGLLSRFDRDRFPAMKIAKGAEIYNPLQESSFLAMFRLYDKIAKICRPNTFLYRA